MRSKPTEKCYESEGADRRASTGAIAPDLGARRIRVEVVAQRGPPDVIALAA